MAKSKIDPQALLQHLAMLHAAGALSPGAPQAAPPQGASALGAPQQAPDPSQQMQVPPDPSLGPPPAPGAPPPQFDPTGGLPASSGFTSLTNAQDTANSEAQRLQQFLQRQALKQQGPIGPAHTLHPDVIAAMHHAVLLHALHSQHG